MKGVLAKGVPGPSNVDGLQASGLSSPPVTTHLSLNPFRKMFEAN